MGDPPLELPLPEEVADEVVELHFLHELRARTKVASKLAVLMRENTTERGGRLNKWHVATAAGFILKWGI